MRSKRKRPLGITLISLPFLWIGCFGTVIFPIMAATGAFSNLGEDLLSPLFHSEAVRITIRCMALTAWFALYVFFGYLGVGLWTLRSKALRATEIVGWVNIGFGAAISLWIASRQTALAISLAVAIIAPYAATLWYLKRPSVRLAFYGRPGGDVAPSRVTSPGSALPLVAAPPPPPVPQYPALHIPAAKSDWWVRSKRWQKLAAASALALLVSMTFAGFLFLSVEKSFHNSEPYRVGTERAERSPCIIQIIGEPIQTNGFVSGDLNESAQTGSANLTMRLRGPSGQGQLDIQATKSQGAWQFESLDFIGSQNQIHLIPTDPDCR